MPSSSSRHGAAMRMRTGSWSGGTRPLPRGGRTGRPAPPPTALMEAMSRLREDDRMVLGYRFLIELSERETAQALGVRPGTVKSRTSRALARLREELSHDA